MGTRRASVAVVSTVSLLATLVAAAPVGTAASPDDAQASGVPSAEATAAWLVDLRHGDRVPLLAPDLGMSGIADVSTSPDGALLAFTAYDPMTEAPQIHLAIPDAGHVRRLSAEPNGADSPAWSPDGERLVYRAGGDGLVIVEIRSGRELARHRTPGRVWLPSFRPDGTRILFTRTQAGHLALWTVDAQGRDARPLRRDAAFGAYSPDGTTIAYHRAQEAVASLTWPFDFGLWLMDADGHRPRSLYRGGGGGWTMAPIDFSGTRPSWSPDGTRLAYMGLGTRTGPGIPGRGPIHVVERTSGNAVVIGMGTPPSWSDSDTLVVQDFAWLGDPDAG